MLEALKPQPADKILAITAAFRADPREEKIDLGVGVYRDAEGRTPIMRAVKEAERRIWQDQQTKAYTGLAGDPAFTGALSSLILGGEPGDRAAAIATPGGTGAVQKALELAKMAGATRVWLPEDTWPNHPAIARHLGMEIATYRYFDGESREVDMDGLIEDLGKVSKGEPVVLHGCCHNPTGANPTTADWERIADVLERTGAVPMIDLAYQGFGDGLEEDAAATRMIAGRLPETMIAASCSKNFGIYRERTGLLLTLCASAARAQENMNALNRMNYSFPPDHGARIVQTVLGDPGLTSDWRGELEGIRTHMLSLREQLSQELRQRTNSDRFDFIARHRGMFSRLGASPEQVETLRERHGIYMVGDSRMNIAGLNARSVPVLAEAIVDVGV